MKTAVKPAAAEETTIMAAPQRPLLPRREMSPKNISTSPEKPMTIPITFSGVTFLVRQHSYRE
ncbi:MAG: hypothetical protein KAT85_04380 [candidate division Zixibacteria bacterium]|nr:hypothetical protein [candidate division Zixibacteria bacterium]